MSRISEIKTLRMYDNLYKFAQFWGHTNRNVFLKLLHMLSSLLHPLMLFTSVSIS